MITTAIVTGVANIKKPLSNRWHLRQMPFFKSLAPNFSWQHWHRGMLDLPFFYPSSILGPLITISFPASIPSGIR